MFSSRCRQNDVLARRLSCSKRGLRSRFGLLLARRLVALLLLFLVRERGERAGNLAHLDVAEGHRELADVMLEEGSVKWLALMPLDDVLNDLVGELDKVVLRARLSGDEPVELLRGGAYNGRQKQGVSRGWDGGKEGMQ